MCMCAIPSLKKIEIKGTTDVTLFLKLYYLSIWGKGASIAFKFGHSPSKTFCFISQGESFLKLIKNAYILAENIFLSF